MTDEPMKQSGLEAQFEMAWRIYGNMSLEIEYEFAKELNRDFRFDYAAPEKKVAIEIDGGQYAPRGGRHNTDKDRDKLNHAACLGWRVLRFSGTMLHDPENCVKMVLWALETK